MNTRLLFSLVIAIFLGLNVQGISASDQFDDERSSAGFGGAVEENPLWGSALEIITLSPKLGAADPVRVLKGLLQTKDFDLGSVEMLQSLGLLNSFVSSEVASQGVSNFIEGANEVLDQTPTIVVTAKGGSTTIIVLEPQEEVSVGTVLNAFFEEKLPLLEGCFSATTVEGLRLASGVEDLKVDSLDGTKLALASPAI